MPLRIATIVVFLLAAVSCRSEDVRPTGDRDDPGEEQRDFDDTPTTVNATAGDVGEIEHDDFNALCGPRSVEDPYIPTSGEFVIEDEQTNSRWNLRGEAYEGPCEGARLEAVPSFIGMWFAWSGTRPGATLWPEGGNEQPGPTPDASGDCEVPCRDILSGGPPPDGIPALDHQGRWNRPQPAEMLPVDEITYLRDHDKVLGVTVGDESRAYPHNLGWWHEIHTDQIDDVEFSVTFCPLTASGIVYPTEQPWGEFVPFVSGRLYNSNLTMWERDAEDPTDWNQMMNVGIQGPHAGEALELMPVVEMTWKRWKELYPDSLVASDDTGYDRDYTRYPYGDFETNHEAWVVPPSLDFGDAYNVKDLVLAVDGPQTSRAWPWPAMEERADRLVINDDLDDLSLVVVFDSEHKFTQPFRRDPGSVILAFSGQVAQ